MAIQRSLLSAGDSIGKCEIVRLLGKGGMGAVYLARHTTLDIFVAVKTLAPDSISEDHREANRFIREAKLAAQIRHPNVVAIMDADHDPDSGFYYIIMEYVDGGSLAEYLRGEALDSDWVFSVIYQVAAALQEAARFGVVHRDIKPHNIMVNEQGVAKLADLGLAKSMSRDSVSLTVMGSALGTPAYMSPQQAEDAKTADVRDDIYSLGATLYECLAGKPPFEGESVYSVITKVVTRTPQNPRDFEPNAPSAMVAICGKMMARDRENRYATADALMADLELVRMQGLDSLDGLEAADYLDWGAPASPQPADPNAPTELMSPSQLKAHGAHVGGDSGSGGHELTQQAVLPAALPRERSIVPAESNGPESITAHTVPPMELATKPKTTIWAGTAVVLLLLVIALLGVGYYLIRDSGEVAPVAGKAPPPPKPAPVSAETPAIGNVTVITDPSGATVSLEGQESKTSPAFFKDLPNGIHTVEIKLKGYATEFRKVDIKAGEMVTPPTVVLQRLVGAMVINTNPPGAIVKLANGQSGTSPATFQKLPVGMYEVTVEKDGYASKRINVEVKRNEVATPSVVSLAAQQGALFVSTDPPGATVTVDGGEGKTSPATFKPIAVGKHKLSIQKDGYAAKNLEVEVKAGDITAEPTVKLQALMAKLKINPVLTGGDYILYQGDSSKLVSSGKSPAVLSDLPAGSYRLVLTHPSDIEKPLQAEEKFVLKGGEEKTVAPKFEYGSVYVTAEPSAHRIMAQYKGKDLGFTPVRINKVPVGEISLMLRNPRLVDTQVTGKVEAGKELKLTGKLERESSSRGNPDGPEGPGDYPRRPPPRGPRGQSGPGGP